MQTVQVCVPKVESIQGRISSILLHKKKNIFTTDLKITVGNKSN